MYSFTKGMIISMEGGGMIMFQWNPSSISIDKKAEWAMLKVAGRDLPVQQFGCGHPRDISFELVFSQSDNGPDYVESQFRALLELTKPKKGSGTLSAPPRVMLILGDSINMQGIVVHVKPDYKSTSNDRSYLADKDSLLPREGHVAVTIREYLE